MKRRREGNARGCSRGEGRPTENVSCWPSKWFFSLPASLPKLSEHTGCTSRPLSLSIIPVPRMTCNTTCSLHLSLLDSFVHLQIVAKNLCDCPEVRDEGRIIVACLGEKGRKVRGLSSQVFFSLLSDSSF